MSTNEQEDERRFYQCVRKYAKILKQFDQLVEMMNARTKPPKRRRVASSSAGRSNATTPVSSSQPDNNEVFVQTISRFLKELRTDSTTNPDCSTSTQNQE
ncbi:hypothetical protein Pint_35630 [Pistacia integerrima]|uniref:Uncharacterized protein n=1 Tax=Pistacia integerrima TaxID=434235 RepID=A0ACC0Y1D7_9ROSI|nr:hypothetical protein Pint_35630 [Pistacia integerrima]